MKIFYLSSAPIPFNTNEIQSAESIFIMKMCEAFSKIGHDVTLVARNYKDLNVDEGIYKFYGVAQSFKIILFRRLKIRGRNLLSLFKIYSILSGLDRKDVLIYCREIYSVSLAQTLGFNVIYESHLLPAHKLIYLLEQRLFKTREILKFVTISNALKELYIQIHGPIKNIEAHHDAADENNIDPKLHYNWPSERKTLQIGYIGHLYKGRGIDIILECARQCPEFDFHIIGGDKKDVAHWYSKKRANIFFHGFITPKVTPNLRNKCDILLMPYQRELATAGGRNTSRWMSPMKMFEYMSSKKAIISSDLPVIREVLNDENAILVAPDDAKEWIKAINSLKDEKKRNMLSQKAYEEYRAKYTWEKRAEKILANITIRQ